MPGPYETLQDEVRGLCFDEYHYPSGWPRHRACPCCGSDQIRYLFRKWGIAHDICRDCKFVFMNPYPTDGFLSDLYNASYLTSVRTYIEIPKALAGRSDAPRSMAEEHYTEIIERIGRYRSSGTWLDVGGGIGTFAHRVQRRFPGFRMHLNEMSQVSAKFAREHYGLEVLTDSLATIRDQGLRFDVISIIAVLEHLTHPRQTVQEMLELLAPGGLLLILVPNFTRLNRWWSHGDSGSVTAPYHVSLFNRHNLVRMIRDLAPVRVRDIWEGGPLAFFWMHLARIVDAYHVLIPRKTVENIESVKRLDYTPWQQRLIPKLAALDRKPWMTRLLERIDGRVYLNVLVQMPEMNSSNSSHI